MAIRRQSLLFHRLRDFGTGRLPANATLDQQRYVILDTIGKGGMGAVYLAQDAQLARLVAIKEMSQAHLNDEGELQRARQHFQDEAEMLQRLQHTNLPQVYGWFQENDRSYLVMEYIQGKSLFEILKGRRGSPLLVEDVFNYGLQLCDVLTYLHSRIPPIVFHDLKPTNVMLRDDGHLFLIDFGIARFFHKDRRRHPDTEVFVTAGYSPPEQYSGQTTPQSDLFSLGATLHHCLTGQNPQSHTQAHVFEFPPADLLNHQVPRELSLLVQEMLSMQPHERPADASAVRRRLHQIRLLRDNPQVRLVQEGTVSPDAPTVNMNVSTPSVSISPWQSFTNWLSAVFIGLVAAGIDPFNRFVDGLKQGNGRNVGQAVDFFWQQQVSQFIGLSGNRRVWERSFTFFWAVTLVLMLSGSIYLLRTVPDAPHVVGLVLIAFALCTFGFVLSGKRLTDMVPRSFLILMIAAFLLAGMALQAEPDMDTLIHSSLQSLTLNLIGAFALMVGGLVCLLRPGQRLLWVEQVMVGLLALGGAILQYGFGLVALQMMIPQLSVELAQTLNVVLIGTLVFFALLALFRTSKPLQGGSRVALVLIAANFVFVQYTSGFQEWQHFLAANDSSTAMLQRVIILSFVCTWAPVVCALLALSIRQPWANRIVLVVLAFVEAMMLAYQGQQIAFPLLPGNPYPLSISILDAQTFSQLVGPILVLVACLALFRLPRSPLFQALDHVALLVGSLICARLDEAFWQAQSAPLSDSMDQQALGQQFTILTGQLLAVGTYLLLFALPLAVLVLAFCYFWRQSHPLAQIDPWLKRLQGAILLMERLLVLVMIIIALVLQGFAGTLQLVFTPGANGLFVSNSPDYLDLFVLSLLLLLAIVGLVLLVRLFRRSSQKLGRSERFALLLATLSLLFLIGQHPDFLNLPLLGSEVQLTGNILHWPGWLNGILFLAGLLLPSLLAVLWMRRSFFAQYRELLRLPFLLVMACAVLQFFWPILLPVSLIVFIASVLLLVQIEKVE